MFVTTLLDALKRKLARKPERRRASFVPRILVLEDRTLPSTFTVLNLNDSGFGSLRRAVLLANLIPGADVIQFTPGLSGTITLTTGQLTVVGDVTINGPGADKIAVSGNNTSRIFFVLGAATDVTVSGLHLTQGKANQGGGIYNLGAHVIVANSVIAGNQAQGGPGAH
ncbi:MAG: hypothetical protein L0211_03260, partial [Planctomycetaceae bacterium]|nr:hypothetical protein [Planctomycetaceae bacterium]